MFCAGGAIGITHGPSRAPEQCKRRKQQSAASHGCMTPHKDEPLFFDHCEAVFFDFFKNHPDGWASETIGEALKRDECRHFLHDVGGRDLRTGRPGGSAPDATTDAKTGSERGLDSSDCSRYKSAGGY